MSVYQISRIQHRRGTSGELPNALDEGEFGMTTDTGEVFIGAQNHPSVSGRRTYPYQNIKIITELDMQRGITGDVYYHGPLIGVVTESNSIMTSLVSLFNHNERDFANYDFSLESIGGGVKCVGMMTVCVHPSDPDQSTIKVSSDSVCYLNWEGAPITSAHFKLTKFDITGQDSGTTWLAFNNNFGVEFTLSISGREWATPMMYFEPPQNF